MEQEKEVFLNIKIPYAIMRRTKAGAALVDATLKDYIAEILDQNVPPSSLPKDQTKLDAYDI